MKIKSVSLALLWCLIVVAAQSALAQSYPPRTRPGGWLLLTADVALRLPDKPKKQYMYVYEDRWYLSPATTLVWDWSQGQELTGDYTYFDGTSVGSYTCAGSDEKPWWGIGCSDGGGGTPKTLTIYSNDPATGQGIVCQDFPDAFGVGPCAWATFYVRIR